MYYFLVRCGDLSEVPKYEYLLLRGVLPGWLAVARGALGLFITLCAARSLSCQL